MRLKSSKLHRQAQRINGLAEIAGNALQDIIPGSSIPGKVAQSINSGMFLFKPNVKPHEKLINALQLILSLSEVGLLLSLIFVQPAWVSLAINAIDLVYQGILLLSWGQSEISKENNEPINL